MRNLLAFLGAAILTVLVLGWYLGWYNISREPSTSGHSKLEVDINSEKIGQDLKQGEQKVQGFLDQNTPANSTPAAPATPSTQDPKAPTPFSPPDANAKPKQTGQSRAEDALKDLILDEVFPPKQGK